MTSAPSAQVGLLAIVAGRLQEQRFELINAQMIELRKFRSYDRVPDEDLRRSCTRNVARVVATLEQRDALPPDIEEDERSSGQRRALQAVPTDDVVKAYRAVLSVLRDAFIEEATRISADPWEVLTGTRKLWELTDRYSDVLVAARQQVDIDTARRDEQHRVALLHRLVTGSLESTDLSVGGAVHSVIPDLDYWVIRAHQEAGELRRLSHHLESASVRGHALIAPLDGDVAALSTIRPPALPDSIIAIGGPARLADVPQAFADATRVLEVATRYGLTGVVDRSSLSIRLAVEQHHELGEQLFRRYLSPVSQHAGSAEIIDTLKAFLGRRRSVADTAKALSVHQNTIRYRVGRFEALASADLTDTDTFVEVWWALEYAKIRRPAR